MVKPTGPNVCSTPCCPQLGKRVLIPEGWRELRRKEVTQAGDMIWDPIRGFTPSMPEQWGLAITENSRSFLRREDVKPEGSPSMVDRVSLQEIALLMEPPYGWQRLLTGSILQQGDIFRNPSIGDRWLTVSPEQYGHCVNENFAIVYARPVDTQPMPTRHHLPGVMEAIMAEEDQRFIDAAEGKPKPPDGWRLLEPGEVVGIDDIRFDDEMWVNVRDEGTMGYCIMHRPLLPNCPQLWFARRAYEVPAGYWQLPDGKELRKDDYVLDTDYTWRATRANEVGLEVGSPCLHGSRVLIACRRQLQSNEMIQIEQRFARRDEPVRNEKAIDPIALDAEKAPEPPPNERLLSSRVEDFRAFLATIAARNRRCQRSLDATLTEITDEFEELFPQDNLGERALLGLATSRELLIELHARLEVDGLLDYKTYGGEHENVGPRTSTNLGPCPAGDERDSG